MFAALRCPTCSAPLPAASPHARSLTCPYCGASVLLTERPGGVKAVERLAAGEPAGAVPAPAPSRGGGRRALLAVLVAGLIGAYAVRRAGGPAAEGARSLPPPPPVASVPGRAAEAPRTPAFAEPVLRFGSEGVGAGRFTDARSVAVDGAGRIYVAEYSGGRVQVFDSLGTFLTQWVADPEMPLVDLAADRAGTVYVVQSGRIRRFEGAAGTPLSELPRPRASASYSDVAPALDGTLYAVAGHASIVHLSREGRVLRTTDLQEAVGPRVMLARVAVSGTGDLFALDRFTGEVYRLDASGRFVDRFGGRGDGPGHLRSPSDLAVDGRGRVYVSDLGAGIRVFDASGHALDAFAGSTVVFGLAFNDRDELFAAHRNAHEVVKYRLTR